jgi:hypothetical protein
LYFDAEEGVLRDEDGDTVTFEMDTEESEDASEDMEALLESGLAADDDDDGSRTPQPAASSSANVTAEGGEQERATQTIRSTSSDRPATPRRPSRLRRLSSATRSRVSGSFSLDVMLILALRTQ